jgi:hypothetical protein
MCGVNDLAAFCKALLNKAKEISLRLCVQSDGGLIEQNNDWRIAVLVLRECGKEGKKPLKSSRMLSSARLPSGVKLSGPHPARGGRVSLP